MKSNMEKARRHLERLVAEGLATREESDPEYDRRGHHVAGRGDVVVRYRATLG
jgi:predicted ArsR family transcriptional regulator